MQKTLKGVPLLWENEHCLIFDKPQGLAVQGGAGIKVSLDSLLEECYTPRPLLVHRLDRDTSGLILAAKNGKAAADMAALFARGALKRRYLGVCTGIPREQEGRISLDLEEGGKVKKAETRYRVLQHRALGEQSWALLELDLGTGRMHQIRRHLAQIGHPLLGDQKYGDFALNRALKKTMGLKQLLLHAWALTIPPSAFCPGGLEISAPPPEYFELYIEPSMLRR
ncbi:MAG: RNA pseudouridine synthase [Treponema sp.]|nr:RNA pseudouridine synthase [Treponema sp.]